MIRFEKLVRTALLPLFTFAVLGASKCSGGTAGQVVLLRKCDVVLHDDWPGNLVVTKPSECPIKIPSADYPVDFAEGGTFDPYTVGNYRLTFYNANDEGIASTYTWSKATIGGTLTPRRDTVAVFGTYRAGTAGFDGSKTDRAVNDLEVSGTRRLSTVLLEYQRVSAASVAGPTIVNPNFDFFVDADLHVANAVPPLSWGWYYYGSFVGSDEALAWNSGAEGEVHEFEVRITDANGDSWTANKTVSTRTCEIECTQ